jgi:integrase
MITTQPHIKFDTAWEAFLLAKRNREVSNGHMINYHLTRRYWKTFQPALTLEEITSQHIREWIAWLRGETVSNGDAAMPAPPKGRTGRLSSGTVHVHYRNMNCFMTWCEREELIVKSPMRRVDRPVVEEVEPDVLDEREAFELLQKVKTSGDRNAFRDYVIHLFLLDTDIRLNEFTHLDLNDIDLNAGCVSIRYGKRNPAKGGHTKRIVGLGNEVRKELNLYIMKWRQANDDEKALFVNEYGKRFRNQGLRMIIVRDLKKYLDRQLNRYGTHTHRHTGTTFDMRKTRNRDIVARKAGHTDTKTTERYVHLSRTDFLIEDTSAMDEILKSKGGEIRYRKESGA